jgi:hypothetical protein
MCKNRRLHLVFVMNPLYTMPRKEALKKIRRILEKRESYNPSSNKTTLGTHVSNLSRCLWLLYLFVIVLIVFL